jgi:hypothetical protein
MAKTNFQYEKRQRELEKKRKQEEKAKRKQEAKDHAADDEPVDELRAMREAASHSTPSGDER